MLCFTEQLGLYTIQKCNPSKAYNSRYMPTCSYSGKHRSIKYTGTLNQLNRALINYMFDMYRSGLIQCTEIVTVKCTEVVPSKIMYQNSHRMYQSRHVPK